MINSMQMAIIKKDLRTIVFNKRLFPVLLIVPVMFTIVFPTLIILMIRFSPENSQDLQQILSIIPSLDQSNDLRHSAITFVMNSIIPVFFIIIPIMASSVMAASSFIGEKEKRTLETLLYSPMTLKQIFQAKILASLGLSTLVCLSSFVVMVVVMQLESFFIMGNNLSLNLINWLMILFFVSPAISLLSVTLIVSGSAKSQTVEESQQRAVFLILPVILLIVGQFSGIILINALLLVGLTLVLLLFAWLMMKRATRKFTYEALLKH